MIYAIVVLIVLILDQAVKFWVNSTILEVGATADFIPKFIELTRHHNAGMAYGLLADKPWARWVFVALTIVFCGVIIYMLASNLISGKLGKWLIVLVMAGGIGNCIDRAVNGYVVDMFHFQFPIFGQDFPIFNVADIFVTVGGIAFCAWLIFHKHPEDEKVPAQKAPRTRRAPERRELPEESQDYITQLKKPVVTARADLEQERERARRQAEERERERQAKTHPRPRPQPQPQPQPQPEAEPFAEFTGSPAPAAPKAAPPPRRQAPAARAPAPAPRQEPAAAPAPKKSDMEFTLDDILEEFSGK